MSQRFLYNFAPVILVMAGVFFCPALAQTTTVAVLTEVRTSPDTSETPAFGLAGELHWSLKADRVVLKTGGGWRSVQKVYRPGGDRGTSLHGLAELRLRLVRGFFVSAGVQGGRVSYGEYRNISGSGAAFLEPAYTKGSFSPRAGFGYALTTEAGWLSTGYSYVFPDRITFNNSKSNRTRGHEISVDGCFSVRGRLCVGPKFEYRRLLHEQPNVPGSGTLHANQILLGVRIGWLR